jgi:excisionase family DNA binding protein
MARETGESQSVYRKRIFRRELPVIKLGRNVRVRREDFERWIEHRMVPAHGREG